MSFQIGGGITIGNGISITIPSGGGGGTTVTYWANGTSPYDDFVYFPDPPAVWGIFWYQTDGYLEINAAGWNNTTAFNNLVASGVPFELDPAGFGMLVPFTSTSGWVSQGGGVYRMTGTWPTSAVGWDTGFTDFKFTYSA